MQHGSQSCVVHPKLYVPCPALGVFGGVADMPSKPHKSQSYEGALGIHSPVHLFPDPDAVSFPGQLWPQRMCRRKSFPVAGRGPALGWPSPERGPCCQSPLLRSSPVFFSP